MNVSTKKEKIVFALFTWRDSIEIIFFACAFYALSLWLKSDRQKNLLFYFYGYCLVLLAAHVAELSLLSDTLLFFSPMLCMIFVLVHQRTLQKNFVALRNLIPAQRHNTDWMESLMQTCLIALNNNKELLCVIEHEDSLDDFLTTAIPLQADAKKGLLDILIDSHLFNAQEMLWINSLGIVRGINVQWNVSTADIVQGSVDEHQQWKHRAVFFSSKTDALILKTHAATRTFDIIVQGTTHAGLTAQQALHGIKKHITKKITRVVKDITHDTQFKNSSHPQSHA